MSAASYSRLSDEDENPIKKNADLSKDESVNATESSTFIVTILNKEKAYDIPNVTSTTKLSQFKLWIMTVTGVDVAQQRLIYAGRRLEGNEKPLSEFRIIAACRVHLFPIPIANLINATATSSATSVNATALNENRNNAIFNPILTNHPRFNNPSIPGGVSTGHTPMHFDEFISQSSREVKLWSTILIFLSLMTLMDVFSALLTNAADLFGNSLLHSTVVILNTVSS